MRSWTVAQVHSAATRAPPSPPRNRPHQRSTELSQAIVRRGGTSGVLRVPPYCALYPDPYRQDRNQQELRQRQEPCLQHQHQLASSREQLLQISRCEDSHRGIQSRRRCRTWRRQHACQLNRVWLLRSKSTANGTICGWPAMIVSYGLSRKPRKPSVSTELGKTHAGLVEEIETILDHKPSLVARGPNIQMRRRPSVWPRIHGWDAGTASNLG
ncbi:hypothetical protein FBZ94_11030 [Bradyrhizobium sacchari]|uniref:Uncharacterized protein n=1 Tax=Bradyrhizobium sacchari TaxID=1399419 RepID=A0A560I265_9BRAD|nr:hypothetical protein FBZ94_11030 [Bradyrhizobium sacchari]TWB69434.1 hypothetical protein FBZ95_10930 [Bradyrhizobium sacchari]